MHKLFPNGYALVVGVGADLPGSIDDAEGLASILTDPDRCAYPDEQVLLLTGREATRKNIERGLVWLRSITDEESTVIIYFSGHGVVSEADHSHYLLPNDYELTRYKETGISGADFARRLKAIPARKLLVILDSSHAAAFLESEVQMAKAPLPAEVLSLLDAETGRVIIVSSREDEYSHAGRPYSVFTQALLEAFSGQGASHLDGFVRVSDLALHAREVVPQRTKGRQHPTVHLEHADNFVLAYYAGGNKLTRPLSFTQHAELIPDYTRRVQAQLKEPFTLHLDPGTASPEEIGQLLHEISKLYQMLGGSGITFTPTEIEEWEVA